MREPNLLVINPNSTQAMTDEVRASVQRCAGAAGAATTESHVQYMTGPHSSPRQIDGNESSMQSCAACLPLLTDPTSPYYYRRYDGVLVACFSDHPLASAIQALPEAPLVVGLLSCSVAFAAGALDRPFSIITSNAEWVAILDAQTQRFLTKAAQERQLWRGTVSTELQVLELHNADNFQRIADRILEHNVGRLGSSTVILGCAGFSGMQYTLGPLFGGKTTFIDPVVLGFQTLATSVRYLIAERCRARRE